MGYFPLEYLFSFLLNTFVIQFHRSYSHFSFGNHSWKSEGGYYTEIRDRWIFFRKLPTHLLDLFATAITAASSALINTTFDIVYPSYGKSSKTSTRILFNNYQHGHCFGLSYGYCSRAIYVKRLGIGYHRFPSLSHLWIIAYLQQDRILTFICN